MHNADFKRYLHLRSAVAKTLASDSIKWVERRGKSCHGRCWKRFQAANFATVNDPLTRLSISDIELEIFWYLMKWNSLGSRWGRNLEHYRTLNFDSINLLKVSTKSGTDLSFCMDKSKWNEAKGYFNSQTGPFPTQIKGGFLKSLLTFGRVRCYSTEFSK